jgi:hypothetical protein
MGLFSSEYKFSCKFKSPTKGEGKLSCVLTMGRFCSKMEALEQLQEELTAKCADAKIIVDTVKFEKL